MCGICGEFRRDHAPADQVLIKAMTARLSRRGPDGEGFYFSGPVGLGHRRLAVIDLPGGAQPMSNEDGTLHLVFNGEIYNFQELREGLVSRGHRFKTRSDTEVILHQYEEEGPECVHRFNGMFSFAIWDEKERTLFLARDRLGIKPLYYLNLPGRFVFASEVWPLLLALSGSPEIDRAALFCFLTIQYAPAPATLFREVRELPPGCRMTITPEQVKEERYYTLSLESEPLAPASAEEAIREALADSVRLRLISDVPLGAFLSGGIDSTSVVAFMKKWKGQGVETFSVDFEAELGAEKFNETRWAELAARTFNAEHHRLTVSAAEALSALPEVVAGLDDLISDPAVIPTYIMSRFARERVVVCLSGEGGDELFAGYQRYGLASLVRFYQLAPSRLRRLLFESPAKVLPRMRRVRKALAALGETTPARRHLAWLFVLPPEIAEEMIGPDHGGEELALAAFAPWFNGQESAYDLERTLRADLATWLPDDLLTKVDRASMAHGLECRVPFLDHRLVELALRIPAREKADLFRRKKIFKKAMKGIVPEPILRRKKAGFTLPLDQWFRKELKPIARELLDSRRLREQGIFNPEPVERLLKEHLSGRENQGHQLFSLLIFQLWHDTMKKLRRPG